MNEPFNSIEDAKDYCTQWPSLKIEVIRLITEIPESIK